MIEQIKNRKAAIHNTNCTVEELQEVLDYVYPKDTWRTSGSFSYYYDNILLEDKWAYTNSIFDIRDYNIYTVKEILNHINKNKNELKIGDKIIYRSKPTLLKGLNWYSSMDSLLNKILTVTEIFKSSSIGVEESEWYFPDNGYDIIDTNNLVIESVTRGDGVKIIEYFKSLGFDTRNHIGDSNSNVQDIYYGTMDGEFRVLWGCSLFPNTTVLKLENIIMSDKNNYKIEISVTQMKAIINMACHTWKEELAKEYGYNIALNQSLKITKDRFQEYIKAATVNQLEYFKKEFPNQFKKDIDILEDKTNKGHYSLYTEKNGFYVSGVEKTYAKDTYPTVEIAKIAKEQHQLYTDMSYVARIWNEEDNFIPDWNDYQQDKYGLLFRYMKIQVNSYSKYNYFVYGISVSSINRAKELSNLFKDRIIKYYGK